MSFIKDLKNVLNQNTALRPLQQQQALTQEEMIKALEDSVATPDSWEISKSIHTLPNYWFSFRINDAIPDNEMLSYFNGVEGVEGPCTKYHSIAFANELSQSSFIRYFYLECNSDTKQTFLDYLEDLTSMTLVR